MANAHRIPVKTCLGCLSLALFALAAPSVVVSAAGPPVLLVYGFQPIPGFRATQVWEDVAEHLAGSAIVDTRTIEIEPGHNLFYLSASDAEHRDVFFSDYALAYEPTVRDLRFYAKRLSEEIKRITSEFSVPQVDVVAHSMGALVTRAYIECDDFDEVVGSEDFPDHGTEYRGDVRTLISVAAPHHGAFLASFGQWLSRLGRQLSPEGKFLELLNRDRVIDDRLISLHPDVRYVSMAGQTCFGCGLRLDEEACLRECVDAGLAWQGSDLVVLMASAYLPEAENVVCIGMDHVDMHTHPVLSEAIEGVLDGGLVPDVIYASPELRFDAPNT
jgi:pimeloyl-ACP methyl ester carboxylesterase